MKKLIIVESPAKIKTISKFLGSDFKIMSTMGHIKDLPSKELGVTINGTIDIHYVTLAGKEKTIAEICKAARGCDEIFLAPDPDREGEIIAWHANSEIEKVIKKNAQIHRITFNEITKKAILAAIDNPQEIDAQKVAAQQARRVLDRWVGYEVSPIYILGFLLKIQHEGMLTQLLRQYGGAVVIIVTLQVTFLALFYLVASSFRLRKAYEYVMNALPSYITAFSTMSSVATIPVSIVSAEKNTHNRPLADVAMPIMANVHLMGDSVGIPVLVLVTLSIFSGVIPSFSTYLTFVFYFCTSMFAVSGIPGGAIIVMIPILVDLFNFTPDMVSVITTLYLLLDSFETAGNVMGDGALIIIVDKILKRMGFARTHESSEKDTN